MSSDPAVVLYATQSAYREPFSSEDVYCWERMVPLCVQFMDSERYLTVSIAMLFLPFIRYQCIDSQDLQIAALRLLNKITEASEATMILVNAGAIPKIEKLLRSQSTKVVDHSVRVLSAIFAMDSEVFKHNIIETCLQMITEEQPVSMNEKHRLPKVAPSANWTAGYAA